MKRLERALWNKVDQVVFDRVASTAQGGDNRIITVSASDLAELGVTEGRAIRMRNESSSDKRSAVVRVYLTTRFRLPGMSRALRAYFGLPTDAPSEPGVARFRDWAFSLSPHQFDVFLCHNSKDKVAVRDIANTLRTRGIVPWFDETERRPGTPWLPDIEAQIQSATSAAIFIGENGLGPWHREELNAFLREAKTRDCPVIPVILKTAPEGVHIPLFLDAMTRVDFRTTYPDPVKQLVYGITGEYQD